MSSSSEEYSESLKDPITHSKIVRNITQYNENYTQCQQYQSLIYK